MLRSWHATIPDQPMRAACIDIGSNTTRLLVGERSRTAPGALRVVVVERFFLRITVEDRLSGLPEEKAAMLCRVVADQAATARAAGADALRVVATAALRTACDRTALCERLAAAAGTEVEVLSPDREAALAFAGATACTTGVSAALASVSAVAVADIGGGSTELACGRPGGPPSWWTSVPLGSGTLTDLELDGDPCSPAAYDRARRAVAAALAPIRCPDVGTALVVGGGASALVRLVGPELDRTALTRAHAVLDGLPARAIAHRLALDEPRARLVPAGLLLLAGVLEVVGRPLHVAASGLREGVVLALLG
jgi:exopolyphosphatase/guanosine-5'-triphosphate,3'-diphosphate pyrophosphatase